MLQYIQLLWWHDLIHYCFLLITSLVTNCPHVVHSNSFVGLLHQNIYYFSCIPLSNDFTFEVFICQSGNQDYFYECESGKTTGGSGNTLSCLPSGMWSFYFMKQAARVNLLVPRVKPLQVIAWTYLQLPLWQWGADNVYFLVSSSWKVNIAENPIAVVGL